MQHLGTQPLETARLRLDRLRLEQAADYTHIWDPEPIDEAVIQARAESLARRIAQFDRPEGYCWGLYRKQDGRLVGEIFAVNQDDRTRSCEIAYGTAPTWRNQGYMSEALAAVLRFLLLQVGYNRVQAGHLADNPASGRVMQKTGMTYEGTLRQDNLNPEGQLTDSKIYSMIRDDL